jgi:hypothetical protein
MFTDSHAAAEVHTAGGPAVKCGYVQQVEAEALDSLVASSRLRVAEDATFCSVSPPQQPVDAAVGVPQQPSPRQQRHVDALEPFDEPASLVGCGQGSTSPKRFVSSDASHS